MGTLNEDLTGIKAVEDKLTANKVANFAYTDHAYNNPLTEADGVTVYDVNHEQNIPVSDPTVLNVNETVLSKGWRSQASAITRMLMNHFLGRVSYNLNKLNDNFSATLATIMSHLGQPNGIATLDANGRIPYAQLPESAIEYEGNWNASTNTPTLVDGTGTKGDFYICNVAGTVDFGSGAISFLVNDRVIYDGAVWSKLSAGDVRTVNGIAPDSATGNVQLAKGDIGLGSVVNTGDSANASSGGTAKFTTGGAYNLLISLASLFNTSTAYAVGDIITYQNRLYECTTAHSAGAWNASHFTARSVEYLLRTYILPSLAPVFSTSTAYTVGQFVIYQNKLYRCTTAHSAGDWNGSHFTLANLNDITANNLINQLPTETSNLQDADYFISQTAGGGSSTTTYKRKATSKIWDYIKGKLTGAISGVLTSNLTASRMVVTDTNGKLTVASSIGVTGVKGNSETNYRTGDVNITKSNIGLGSVVNTGDSATPVSGGTTKFTTGGAYTELNKKVNKTTTVNGHALSGNVTVTKSDVGLGSVTNTGDSATPVSGGTTKFTTGGAYNFFGGNTNANKWLSTVFADMIGWHWKCPANSNASDIRDTVAMLDGNIYVATGHGLQVYNLATHTYAQTYLNGVACINLCKIGSYLLVGTTQGLYYKDVLGSSDFVRNATIGNRTCHIRQVIRSAIVYVYTVTGTTNVALYCVTQHGSSAVACTGITNNTNIPSFVYGNNMVICVGFNLSGVGLYWSTDYTTFTRCTINNSIANNYMSVTYNEKVGVWFAFGAYSNSKYGRAYSVDGKNWYRFALDSEGCYIAFCRDTYVYAISKNDELTLWVYDLSFTNFTGSGDVGVSSTKILIDAYFTGSEAYIYDATLRGNYIYIATTRGLYKVPINVGRPSAGQYLLGATKVISAKYGSVEQKIRRVDFCDEDCIAVAYSEDYVYISDLEEEMSNLTPYNFAIYGTV